MSCARTRRSVGPLRWTWQSTCSTACWSWDARTTSASPNPGPGWGHCARIPDPCNTAADDAVQWHVLLDGIGAHPRLGVAADQVKGPDHRPMHVVVGPEIENGQQVQHRASVVAAVGTADRGAERGAIGGAGRLALAHQVTERLFAHHGEQHLADGAVRFLDGGAGQVEQEALLAADTLEVVQQLLLDLV